MQLGIDTVVFQQFGVGALFEDLAALHHQDMVGMLDRRQAMRDHQGGAIFHQVFHRMLDEAFRLGIQRRSRLVEYQYRSVFQQRPRNCNALTLAAG